MKPQPAFANVKRANRCTRAIEPSLLREQIIDLIYQYRSPSAVSPEIRAFPDMGGLIAYVLKRLELYRKTATYVDKILRGAKPGRSLLSSSRPGSSLPSISRPRRRSASPCPPSMLARADEVIE